MKTSIVYGSTTSSVANNLDPTSVTKGAGDGSLSATTTIAYTADGDVQSIDGPLSGSDDLMFYRYDSNRRVVGIVGPDPDGSGSLKHRAIRITRNGDGQVTLVENGTVNSTSDSDWSGFTTINQVATTYDSAGRHSKAVMSSGGTTYSVVQLSWDAASRPDCTATRMNPSTFSSPPSSACTAATTGSNGPDRIVKNTYDAADQRTKVTTAYGTSIQRDEVTTTYGDDGEPLTVADAKGQLTTYEYDGLNRVVKMRLPNPSSPTSSSTTDYEAYAYDAASNTTQLTRRGGDVVSYSFDHLSRLTTTTPPTGQAVISLAYDGLSRPTSVSFSGHTITNTFDALSRMTSQAGPLGTVSYQYDVAGRRTRMTWPDSLYVTYDYDLADEVTAIRENGATSGAGVLATFTYDDLGRRTGLSRGNGVSTTYSYDGASELTSIAHDLSGTTNDQTLTYTYNAAGQVLTSSGSNSSYTWAGATNTSVSYTADGQNKYTAVGSASYSYDGRANLTSDGTNTFGYDTFNRLTSGPSSATLSYDPLSRLYQTVGGGVTTKMQYDGSDLIAEYNSSGTMQRRYVHGPGTDEPLVWYEGSGTTDRRWMIADSLGSVIGVTNSSGASTTINTYDNFGVPGSSNAGRFQYAGQPWIPEVGLYHYRARAYSPTLGRFMQTDPIGYAAGMNIYNYVSGDPINLRDPSGLQDVKEVVVHGKTTLDCRDNPSACTDHAALENGGGQVVEDTHTNERPDQAINQVAEVKIVAQRNKKTPCPAGPYTTISVGGSFTAAWFGKGFNLSVNINLTRSLISNTPLYMGAQGQQLSITFQRAKLRGAGGFIEGGVNIGGGLAKDLAKTGKSFDEQAYGEGDAAFGEGASASAQVPVDSEGNPSGVSGAGGIKPSVGVGLYAGYGVAKSVTFATPPLDCTK